MPATYTNPVHPGPFPDPFVLEVGGTYYAYSTDIDVLEERAGGRAVEMLRSTDLVTWASVGRVLVPIEAPDARDYWAPEVAHVDGRFYMYYSVGIGDRGHHLRVAVSDRAEGPFRDQGLRLTGDDVFTIDAHPFRDVDGTWYLYYARDFLDGERVGTSIVVDRMRDMLTLEGAPRSILRASADWQIFHRQREMYGGVYDWYTLEGPFVLHRRGRYWLLYSGGAWTEPNYGVSYAVADSPLGPFTEAPADGPTLLRSIRGRVIGPGHNSVVTGPDGEDYLVYHAWDPDRTERRMCIDRLEWTDDGPRTDGPTFSAAPVPLRRP